MANDNRIQLYVSDEVKKTLEAYAKYHDVSVSKAGAELLMQGAMNWSPSEDTQRYKNQPVNADNAEMSKTEYVTRGEFTAMMASMCAQVGITLGEIRGASILIEETVNEAKRMKEKENKEKILKEFSKGSNVKLG